MALNILRGLFVLLMAAVGYSLVTADLERVGWFGGKNWLAMAMCLSLGVLIVVIDIVGGRRKLAVFSGVAFGMLVGATITYALSFGVTLLVDNLVLPGGQGTPTNTAIINFLNLLIGTVTCYFSVSFILQTKDDFRFIIPYVEFRRDARGSKPIVVDTSALIDGRLEAVAAAGFLDARLVVPQFVVAELQQIADSPDRIKRSRGRRGLDALTQMRNNPAIEIRLYDTHAHEQRDAEESPVDQRLVDLARELDGKALTVDFNLAKVAALSGVPVLNLNELSRALRTDVLPGESHRIEIERRGTGEGQGVGHLEDGTMVVVEGGGNHIGETVNVVVTNTTQTSAGRMIFARSESGDGDGTPPSPATEVKPSRQNRRHRSAGAA